MTDINQALLKTSSNVVDNIIVAPAGFTLSGYTAIQIQSGVFCSPGMYYNSADSLFYQDAAFTTIYPLATNTADTSTTDETTTTTTTTTTDTAATATTS